MQRWHVVDPSAENYLDNSPYNYVGNNPIRRKDIDGKDWFDKVKGAVAAVVDNVTGLDTRGSFNYSDAADYNTGQNIGDAASAIAGAAITDAGLTSATAGAVVAVGSGGTLALPGVAVAATGAGAAAGGAIVATRATVNLANQKGRVNAEGQSKVGSESKPHNSERAARRDAMRQEKIPTSQQLSGQQKTPAGKVYKYDVPKSGGGTTQKQVQQQTKDTGHGLHYEAGTPKSGGQKDAIGRDRLQNDKSKSFYNEK